MFHSPLHPLWPPMRRWTMCKSTRRRPRHCKAPCRSGPMCGSLLNLPRGSSPDTDLYKEITRKQNKIPFLSQASPGSCFYHYYEYWLGLFKTEIYGQKAITYPMPVLCDDFYCSPLLTANMQDIRPYRWSALPKLFMQTVIIVYGQLIMCMKISSLLINPSFINCKCFIKVVPPTPSASVRHFCI